MLRARQGPGELGPREPGGQAPQQGSQRRPAPAWMPTLEAPRAKPGGTGAMRWGLGGVSRQAGLLQLQGSPQALEATAPRGTRLWSAEPGPGLGWPKLAEPPGPRLCRDVAGRRRFSSSRRCRLPLPSDNKRQQRQPHSCYGNPGLQAAAGRVGKEGSSTPGAGGTPGRRGGDLRGSDLGSGVRGWGARVGSLTSGTGKAPRALNVGHFTYV